MTSDHDFPDIQGPRYTYSPERHCFIRKVFLIAVVMFLMTFAFAVFCYHSEFMTSLLHSYVGDWAVCAVVGAMVGLFALTFYCDFSRHLPFNFIMNFLMVICNSIIVSYLCVRYAPIVIMGAFVTTLAISIVCFALAFSKIDFTDCGIVIITGIVALLVVTAFVAILSIVFNVDIDIFNMAMTIGSAVVLSVCLIVEIQSIITGRFVDFGEKDYCLAALIVYFTVMMLFMELVKLIADSSGDGGRRQQQATV